MSRGHHAFLISTDGEDGSSSSTIRRQVALGTRWIYSIILSLSKYKLLDADLMKTQEFFMFLLPFFTEPLG